MLGWSIHLFRIRGIRLSVHVTFLLLLGYAAWKGWSDGGGLVGLAWGVASLLAFFTCVVLHELGHSFAAMHYGIRVPRILLMPIGGMAEMETIPREPSRELVITFAGPLVNLVIAVLLWFMVDFPEGWLENPVPTSLPELLRLLCVANVVMFFFNLLPIFPMDGGRILRACLAWCMPYVQATYCAALVAKILAVLGALFMAFVAQDYLAAFLFLFIFYVGDREYRAVKQRELEEERYRETVERLHRMTMMSHGTPPLLLVPPILGASLSAGDAPLEPPLLDQGVSSPPPPLLEPEKQKPANV